MLGSTFGRADAARTAPSRAFSSAGRLVAFVAIVAAAVVAVGAFLVVGYRDGLAVSAKDLAIAVVAFTISQLARLPLRLGAGVVMIAWGEVGIVTVICLLPAAWAPLVVGVGAVLGHGQRLFRANPVKRAGVVVAMAAIVLAGAAATAVVGYLGLPMPVRVDLQRPITVVDLLVAVPTFYLVLSLIIAFWIAAGMPRSARDTGNRVLWIWLQALRGKRSMLVGNAAVALAVAVLIGVDVWWLAAMAPVLWFLHQMYLRDLRAATQRRTWSALADATRGLSQLDERAVAAAALRGAAEVFAPRAVEISLRRPSGKQRRYIGRTRDLIEMSAAGRGFAETDEDEPPPAPDADADQVVVRQLVVGGQRIGELRLIFAGRPGRRQWTLRVHEQHALSTYADAVASALHDASSNRQLQAMAARGAYDAVHDVLTGLSNRSTLIARGNARLSQADPTDTIALVLLDINGLRAVNDALSYPAGDELLKVLARRLAEGQVETELVGRLGGDEFAVMRLGAEADLSWAYGRARELMSLFAAPAQVAGVTIAMEASAGVVVESVAACDMAELLRRADVALHLAKRDGLRLIAYDPAGDAASTDRLALLAELRDALATTDQLMMYFQPCVDLATGMPVGVEALVRWQHPRRGLLGPTEFIQAIEHSEMAEGFTRHVLDMALSVAAGWATDGLPVALSVNVCARCLLNPTFPDVVAQLLRKYGVAPEQLIVEITEAVMGAELDVVATVVAGLRRLGVQVSVDDFGTESASLALLTGFAVDEVKIDRSFVATMADSAETAAIVRATVDIARQLGLRVVAQGVEHAEQHAVLRALGVHAGQGYLFAPALTPTDAIAKIRALMRSPSPQP